MNPSMHRTRSGAALIIAIIVLAALLMLGLPFLFSQSMSLAGTRSFAHAQLARVGGTTAEDLGAGAGSYVMDPILRQGSTVEATTLALLPSITRIGDNRYAFDLSPRGLGFNATMPINTAVIGTVLEDESGKFNPNHMDVLAWSRLFEMTAIADVDDGAGNDRDKDEFKQLAQALAAVRYDRDICPEGRITRLDQLLEARPQPEKPLVRWPLTRAELRQLAPYLTLATLGQGRAGLVDLGTMISKPGANNWNAVLDAEYPVDLLAYPVQRDLIGAGSTVVTTTPGNSPGGMTGPNGTIPPPYEYGLATSIDLSTINDPSISGTRHPKGHRPRTNEAVGIDVPAPINIHQTTREARHMLHDVRESVPLTPAPHSPNGLRGLPVPNPDALNRQITGFDLQNPLGVYNFLDDQQNGQTRVSQTLIGDPNSGLSGMPNGTLTATATALHISGGDLRSMPSAAYGKIEGTEGGVAVFEFISYRDSDPNSGYLKEVRRGLNFVGSTGPHAFDAPARFSFIAPRELPPLAVASQGMITIEGGSTVSDAAGKQGAQRFRRIVMQALPHEELLEARFVRQSQLHTLLVARSGSLVTSYPEPYIRLFDKLPDASDSTPAGLEPPELDKAIGVRPGSMRTLLSATHLGDNRRSGHDWSRSFSMKEHDDDAFSQGDNEYGPDSGGGPGNLTPDGVTINGPLTYRLHQGDPTRGFLTSNPPPAAAPGGPAQGPNIPPELNGRQLGMWVRPNELLTGTVTLLDMRMPSDHAGRPLPGGQMVLGQHIDERVDLGDNYYQNRFNLCYESQSKQLVLTYCNGAIEHINDYCQICPSETFDFPNGIPLVDPRTLGDLARLTALGGMFGSLQPGRQPLAAKRPLNLVQQRYQLSKTDGLKKGTWYQIQIAMLGNDPGHMAIIVNGIVGRDITRMHPKPIACEYPGDHFTLPSLVLKTALPATPTLQSAGARALLIPRIELDAVAVDPRNPGVPITGPAAVAMILPTRGMIRVGNEYISYDNITGGALENCVRSRRQNSIQLPNAGASQWVALEHHEIGDLVVPGGFRFNPGGNGRLWRGGSRLTGDYFPNGDPARDYTVWAQLTTPSTIDMTTGLPVLRKEETTIRVQNGSLAFQDWPPRGYARLNRSGEIIFYDNGTKPTNALNNVQREQFIFPPGLPVLPGAHTEGPGPGSPAQDIIWPASGMPIPSITLLSFEVTGDPTGNYYAPDTNPIWHNGHLLQLYDTTSGRAEWIRYTKFDTSKTGYCFFLDRNGFRFLTASSTVMNPQRSYAHPILGSSRGQQRTAFLPVDAMVDPNNRQGQFPRDTRVIPVQMDLPSAHFITTGDVLTIAPKQPSPTNLPYQVCVRHAATDGFSLTPGLVSSDPLTNWDTRNEFFAFTEALPENYTINTFELLCWPGWSGNDLTPTGGRIDPRDNNRLPPATTPWANAFNAGYASGAACQFMIGGDDTTRPFRAQPNNLDFKGVIDALHSGMQPGGSANPNLNDNVVIPLDPPVMLQNWNSGTLVYDQAITPWISGTGLSDIQGKEIRASTNVFVHDLGLVLIGGEVFAYQRLPINAPADSSRAELIGRGLLGSVPIIHRSYEPMLVLPIGPVGRIVQPLNAGQQEVNISTYRDKSRYTEAHLDSPAVLVSSPDGAKVEVIGMPHRYTAPWLHGMYNSLPQGSFAPVNGMNPLAIGWWPRHPSGLPSQASQAWSSLSTTDRAAALRCRSYAWIGYPLRFHDTYFNRGDQTAEVSLLSDGDGVFTVKAMALDQGFDWTQPYASALTLTTGLGYQDASQVFARFDRKKLDGAELRVFWQYTNPPPTPNKDFMGEYLNAIATAGNTAPMIGKVRLRARAPTRVIQVEEAR